MNRMLPLAALGQYQYPSSYQYAMYDPSRERMQGRVHMGEIKMGQALTMLGLGIVALVGGIMVGNRTELPATRTDENMEAGKPLRNIWRLLGGLLIAIIGVLLISAVGYLVGMLFGVPNDGALIAAQAASIFIAAFGLTLAYNGIFAAVVM